MERRQKKSKISLAKKVTPRAPAQKRKKVAKEQIDKPACHNDDSRHSSDSDATISDENVLDDSRDSDANSFEYVPEEVKLGDWCLFEYQFDSKVYYVGKVNALNHPKVTADFLQCVFTETITQRAKFCEKLNGSEEADLDQIVAKLENPSRSNRNGKRNDYLTFPFDFSSYSLAK